MNHYRLVSEYEYVIGMLCLCFLECLTAAITDMKKGVMFFSFSLESLLEGS